MECKKCGSKIDAIVGECQYCGSTIKGKGLNSMSTEEVIRYANRWIGLMEKSRGGIFAAGVNAKVKEYLGLLDMRADKDALAKRKFFQLKQEYKDALDNIERLKRQDRNLVIAFISIPIILLIIVRILENMGIL